MPKSLFTPARAPAAADIVLTFARSGNCAAAGWMSGTVPTPSLSRRTSCGPLSTRIVLSVTVGPNGKVARVFDAVAGDIIAVAIARHAIPISVRVRRETNAPNLVRSVTTSPTPFPEFLPCQTRAAS